MKTKSLYTFIDEHRQEIDEHIRIVTYQDSLQKHSDNERRLWILNDESLYNWARSEGVRI